jgi:hypothetical protein
MLSLDWKRVLSYLASFVVVAAAVGLSFFYERRAQRRKAELVRRNLGVKRCARCNGVLGAWDGRFHPGDAHFNPGGYLPKVIVLCAQCCAEQQFYVGSDGFLANAEIIFQRTDEERGA